jgi:Na+-driven multidrug efflux pump
MGNKNIDADSSMALNKTIKRELEVAFSKHSQPIWFRVLKYILLAVIMFFFWGTKLLWIILLISFAFAMLLHFWYRYKTQGWTKSYGLWKHDKDRT